MAGDKDPVIPPHGGTIAPCPRCRKCDLCGGKGVVEEPPKAPGEDTLKSRREEEVGQDTLRMSTEQFESMIDSSLPSTPPLPKSLSMRQMIDRASSIPPRLGPQDITRKTKRRTVTITPVETGVPSEIEDLIPSGPRSISSDFPGKPAKVGWKEVLMMLFIAAAVIFIGYVAAIK